MKGKKPGTTIAIYHSLSFKLFLYSVILIFIPVLVIGTLSYLESREMVKRNTIQERSANLAQNAGSLNDILKEAEDITLFLIREPSLRNLLLDTRLSGSQAELKANMDVNEYIWYTMGSKNFLDSLLIVGDNGLKINPQSIPFTIGLSRVRELDALRGFYRWYPPEIVHGTGPAGRWVIPLMRRINDINDVPHRLGFVVLNVSEERLAATYNNSRVVHNSVFLLVGPDGWIYSSNQKDDVGKKIGDFLETQRIAWVNNYAELERSGTAYSVFRAELNSSEFQLYNFVPTVELLPSSAGLRFIVLYGLIGSVLLTGSLGYFFSRKTSGRLKRLSTALLSVNKDELLVELEVKGYDEISLVAESINSMSREISLLFDELGASKLHEKEAELKALEAQINPHFLYNILDTVYWKCRLEKAPEAAELVLALSDLFRLSLNRGDRFTTVEKELHHIKNYIKIQNVKYGDRIQFRMSVEDRILEAKVCKLVLQPLVENAIVHGFRDPNLKGSIRITLKKCGNLVQYVIEDEGCGANPADLRNLLKLHNSSPTIGLRNVNERLRLEYGDLYQLQFEAGAERGLRVIVNQPLEGESNDSIVDH